MVLFYCAFDPTPRESTICAGDSGGPLMFFSQGKWILFGVTSFGFGTEEIKCLNNQSAYFTKIPKYIDWINEKMQLNGTDSKNMASKNDIGIFCFALISMMGLKF